MHPSVHARTTPDKPAYIMAATGQVTTYGEMEARSNQGAHLFRSLGLKRFTSPELNGDWRVAQRFTMDAPGLSAIEVIPVAVGEVLIERRDGFGPIG